MVDRNNIITEATERKLGLRVSFDDVGIVLTLFDGKGTEKDSIYIDRNELKKINNLINITVGVTNINQLRRNKRR